MDSLILLEPFYHSHSYRMLIYFLPSNIVYSCQLLLWKLIFYFERYRSYKIADKKMIINGSSSFTACNQISFIQSARNLLRFFVLLLVWNLYYWAWVINNYRNHTIYLFIIRSFLKDGICVKIFPLNWEWGRLESKELCKLVQSISLAQLFSH